MGSSTIRTQRNGSASRKLRCVFVAGWLLLLTSCSTSRELARLRSAVDAALRRVDPKSEAVLLAHDQSLQWIRERVDPSRPIVAVSEFLRMHPEGYTPFNILVQSARIESDAVVVVHLQVPGISHTPPGVLSCGSGYEFAVRKVAGRWIVETRSESVC